MQRDSPIGVHHLLQLVIEYELGVPAERVHSPDGRATSRGPQKPDRPEVPPAQERGVPPTSHEPSRCTFACTRLPLTFLGKDWPLC